MSVVYIVQNQRWIDRKTNKLVPKFDFTPARKFGQLRELLPEEMAPFAPAASIKMLREGLANFSDKDFLLLTGNPVFIGLAVAVAADINEGRVAMLQWSGTRHEYIPIRAHEVFDFED